VIQQPLSEPVPRVHKRPPRVGADDAIDGESADALKSRDCLTGRVPEHAEIVSVDGTSKRDEPGLDIPDTFSTVALMK
jgi:hypothetical protein